MADAVLGETGAPVGEEEGIAAAAAAGAVQISELAAERGAGKVSIADSRETQMEEGRGQW